MQHLQAQILYLDDTSAPYLEWSGVEGMSSLCACFTSESFRNEVNVVTARRVIASMAKIADDK
eukprot:scaffold18613_cov16-Tisochrysis_lutea.AAC.1